MFVENSCFAPLVALNVILGVVSERSIPEILSGEGVAKSGILSKCDFKKTVSSKRSAPQMFEYIQYKRMSLYEYVDCLTRGPNTLSMRLAIFLFRNSLITKFIPPKGFTFSLETLTLLEE